METEPRQVGMVKVGIVGFSFILHGMVANDMESIIIGYVGSCLYGKLWGVNLPMLKATIRH